MKKIYLAAALLFSISLCAQDKSIALTFDDLPYATLGPKLEDVIEARRSIRSITDTLKQHHAPATAFVNEVKLQVPDQLDMRIALLDQWLDAGVPLGNHTYSHPYFFKTPLPQFEDEVIRGEVITRRLMKARGLEEKYFRHPFLVTGATLEDKRAFEQFLASRDYIVAPVTAENLDWAFNTAYRQAMKDGDQNEANRVLDAYVAQIDIDMDYYEKMSRQLFGRNIAHILLLHSNEINAIKLDEVLNRLEARGYHFITVDEALKDPAYQTPDNYIGDNGCPWLHHWAQTMGRNSDEKNAPDPPRFVLDLYGKAVGAKLNSVH